MNSGNLETSPRLQKTYRLLLDGKWHSSAEIHAATGSMACHSDIAGVRDNIKENGDTVEQRYNGTTPDGNKISEYKLIKKEVPNVPDEIRKLYSDCKKAAASFSGIEASNGHVEKIQLQISDLVNRFPGLNI